MKRKDETLQQFADRLKPGTFESFDPKDLAKEEYVSILGNVHERINDSMNTKPPREQAIEVSGLVEDALTAMLLRAGKEAKRLTFEAKTALALKDQLICAADAGRTDVIRKIRNAFAHDPDLHLFEHSEKVMSQVRKLNLPEEFPPQMCIALTASGLIMIFNGILKEAGGTPAAP